jgi:hypothetical protein
MVPGAPHPKAARAWLDFIQSDAAFGVLARYDFKRYQAKSPITLRAFAAGDAACVSPCAGIPFICIPNRPIGRSDRARPIGRPVRFALPV